MVEEDRGYGSLVTAKQNSVSNIFSSSTADTFIEFVDRKTLPNPLKAGFFVNAKLAAPHIFQGHLSAGKWYTLEA